MTDMVTSSFQYFFQAVGAFFVLYLIGYASFLFFSVAVGTSTLYSARRRNILKNELRDNYFIPVSVIVPAYNEEVTIEATVKSLLNLHYNIYEIIVVDDGSQDKTAETVRQAFSMKKIRRPIHRRVPCKPVQAIYVTEKLKVPVTLITKENGGKADALNMGINAANYPYFLCLDADSVLQCDSLEKIVRPVLENSDVVAVGGAVRPSNGTKMKDGRVISYHMPKKLLPAMQVLEYDRSFLASRILFDKFNGNLIISGAFGLFKKDVVIAAGGYDASTMGEDMELAIKLHVFCREHGMKYRMNYAPDAICWSQVPENLPDMMKQRRRWHIGLFQSMMIHRRIMANTKYGPVSFLSYIYFLIYELFSPYIEVFGVVTMVVAMLLDFLNIPFMLLFMGIYIVYSAIMSLTAFFARVHTIDLHLALRDVIKAISLCAIEVSCLRFIMAWVRATSLLTYRKDKNRWGKSRRKEISYK